MTVIHFNGHLFAFRWCHLALRGRALPEGYRDKEGEVGKRKESGREDRSERGQGETHRLSSETTVGSQSKENSKCGLFIYLFLSARMTTGPSLKEANPLSDSY